MLAKIIEQKKRKFLLILFLVLAAVIIICVLFMMGGFAAESRDYAVAYANLYVNDTGKAKFKQSFETMQLDEIAGNETDNSDLIILEELLAGMSGGGSGSEGGSGPVYTDANTVVKAIVEKLSGMGYNKASIAAILGNCHAESGVKPEVTQGHEHDGQTLERCKTNAGGDGHGLVQWDGSRRSTLITYALERGGNWYDLTHQLNYLERELNSTRQCRPSEMNQLDLEHATYQFVKYFERCSVSGAAGLIGENGEPLNNARYASFGQRSYISGWLSRYTAAQSFLEQLQ